MSAFAPDVGESTFLLAGRFPGSTLSAALAPPVVLSGGGRDLYVAQAKFAAQFAADLPEDRARRMAAEQRPLAEAAGAETATSAGWKTLPSWWIYGAGDRNIPPAAMAFMASRAHARQMVVVPGASHLVMISHPHEVSAVIERAAQGR